MSHDQEGVKPQRSIDDQLDTGCSQQGGQPSGFSGVHQLKHHIMLLNQACQLLTVCLHLHHLCAAGSMCPDSALDCTRSALHISELVHSSQFTAVKHANECTINLACGG